jgi:multidrug efflux system outer membrane protein
MRRKSKEASMIKRALLLAPLALTACMSLAPKYERPALPVAASYDFPTAELGKGAAAIGWQQYFIDARTRQLIDIALANNRDFRVAVLNIEQARAQHRIRSADQLPTVNLGVSGNRATTSGDSIESHYAGGLSVTAFELDLFGRVRSLTDAALAQYLATEEARKSVQISLVASVANIHLTLLADDELLALTSKTLEAREASLKLVQLKYDNGVVSKIDLQQANSLVEAARVTLAQQRRQRAQDSNTLALLVGRSFASGYVGAGGAGSKDSPGSAVVLDEMKLADTPVGMPSELLALRPDIRQAEHQLMAANANIGAARAAYFPRISLTGSAGSASTELAGLFKGGSFGWTFAPQLLMPLFDFGRTSATVDNARAGRDIAVAQYEKTIQVAFREVNDALAGQATYNEQLRAQRAVAAAEAERFALSDLRYRNGAASYLDLLDAQRSLFSAQQAAIQANLARLQNQVTLYRVLGGGAQ